MLKLPFKFRDVQEGTVPDGPDFRSAKEVTLDLRWYSRLICVYAPKHTPKHREAGSVRLFSDKAGCDLFMILGLYQSNTMSIGLMEVGTTISLGVSFSFYGPFLNRNYR